MKKWIACLLALLMISLMLPACAETLSGASAAVYVTDPDGSFLGCGVWISPETVLVPKTAALFYDQYRVVLADGTVLTGSCSATGHACAAVTVENSGIETEAPAKLTAGDGRAVWFSDMGSAAVPVTIGAAITWLGQPCRFVTAAQTLPLGTLVLNADGQACAVLTAVWGEKANTWVALPLSAASAEDFFNDSLFIADESAAAGDVSDMSIEEGAGYMIVTFTPADPEASYAVEWCDIMNPYFMSRTAEAGMTTVQLPAVPGRIYAVQIVKMPQNPDDLTGPDAQACSYFMMSEAETLTDYNFEITDMYIGTLPSAADEYGTDVCEQAETLTAGLFTSDDVTVYTQVCCTYEVTEEIYDNLIMTLETPDGELYMDSASFIYMASLDGTDAWHYSLSGMMRDYISAAGEAPAGTYVSSFYVGGKLGGSISFEIGE